MTYAIAADQFRGSGITELNLDELDMVSGGHDSVDVESGTYVGTINGTKDGQADHYDVYKLENGCTVMIWNAGTTVNVDTGELESR